MPLITGAHSDFHTTPCLILGILISLLLEPTRRKPKDSPMSLVLGEGSEKRGRWRDIAVKKSSEETRGKKMA